MVSPSEGQLQNAAMAVAELMQNRGWMLAVAESCTGGWVAKVCTDLPGSSAWFERGFVTYTNESKQEMLGVKAQTLESQGAVSEATVREMVEGTLRHSRAQLSLAISGIAGPGGGSAKKPIGTVCFAWGTEGQVPFSESLCFEGDREEVRRQAVLHALEGVVLRFDG